MCNQLAGPKGGVGGRKCRPGDEDMQVEMIMAESFSSGDRFVPYPGSMQNTPESGWNISNY